MDKSISGKKKNDPKKAAPFKKAEPKKDKK